MGAAASKEFKKAITKVFRDIAAKDAESRIKFTIYDTEGRVVDHSPHAPIWLYLAKSGLTSLGRLVFLNENKQPEFQRIAPDVALIVINGIDYKFN